MENPKDGYVEKSIEDQIGKITFFHPKGNSLPGVLLAQLAEGINEMAEHGEVKLVILQSAGERAFCGGASFDELLSISNMADGKTFFMGFANVINAIRKCHKFVIGRIQGKAVGGGVGLASAVDYALATERSSVKLSELDIGIGPFVVGPAVERKIGLAAFQAMTIDTQWKSAVWAKEKGLYTNIYTSIELMDHAIDKLCKKLKHSSPQAMESLKEIMWEDCENWNELLEARAEISGRLVLSDYTSEAIAAFREEAK